MLVDKCYFAASVSGPVDFPKVLPGFCRLFINMHASSNPLRVCAP